jgi:signal peptidase II
MFRADAFKATRGSKMALEAREKQMLKRALLVIAILISCVGCDQTAKFVAKSRLSETQAVSYLGGSVRLQLTANYGAFLGLGTSLPQKQRTALLSIGVAVGLAAMLIYCLALSSRNALILPAWGLVIGGGVSNLADRLWYGGYVVDFLNVGIGPIRTGIFNLADVFIMVGVLLLIFSDRFCNELPTKRSTRRARTRAPD